MNSYLFLYSSSLQHVVILKKQGLFLPKQLHHVVEDTQFSRKITRYKFLEQDFWGVNLAMVSRILSSSLFFFCFSLVLCFLNFLETWLLIIISWSHVSHMTNIKGLGQAMAWPATLPLFLFFLNFQTFPK